MKMFAWLFGQKNSLPGTDNSLVDVGDRFFQVGMGSSVWVVERICREGNCNIPHVVINRIGTFPSTKIVSAYTLLNAALYRRDRRDPEAPDRPGNPKRRREDRLRN